MKALRLFNGRPYGILPNDMWKGSHVCIAAYSIADAQRVCVEAGLAGGEVDTPTTGRLVVCDNDSARVWELNREPSWNGMPCTWDEVATAWKPLTGYGDAASLLPAIVLPA